MKIRLLKKLRRKASTKITIISTTSTNGIASGIAYRYSDPQYQGLSHLVEKEKLLQAAEHIYIQQYLKNKS